MSCWIREAPDYGGKWGSPWCEHSQTYLAWWIREAPDSGAKWGSCVRTSTPSHCDGVLVVTRF